jgi:hypothetical protein
MELRSIQVPWQALKGRIERLFEDKTAPSSIHTCQACILETAANSGAEHRCILRILEIYSGAAE